MSEHEKNIVRDYITEIRELLWLKDWRVILLDEVAPMTSNADISPIIGRKLAHLRLRYNFREFSRELQRHTIVHELLHLHFANATHVIEIDLMSHSTISNQGFVDATFSRQMEYGIDGVADAIAHFMPYIDWKGNRAATRK